ncbi:MAG: DUF2283 domain-containing protein [Candidatus Methanoperedens sp.]|jgi:uncharacterized protein YuzE|nr:DUF2283 domain-containing protein [Candidatus Methanoperedens sp.]
MASIEFDSEVNAMYIRFKKGKVDKSEPLADNVIVDVDKNGKAIGIEILLPKQDIRISQLVSEALKVEA